jgi:phospholipid/cholesterol/gamma-HCH transport system permease protein
MMISISSDCEHNSACTIKLEGALNKHSIKDAKPYIEKIKLKQYSFMDIDCSQLKGLDYAGALYLADLIAFFSKQNISVTISELDHSFKSILIFARKNLREKPHKETHQENFATVFLENIGKKTTASIESFLLFLSFLGESVVQFFRLLFNPSQYRYKATAAHIEKSGAQALPIVTLTSFLVGLVLAYQGSEQLSKFGANIFIVDMVSIAIFRELAPMIAAIVIAGRSASAYTAEIGTMKITEEIDAMRTMGFDPMRFLVIPRVVALVLSMPLIVFFADMVGVFGGMIVAQSHLGISLGEFISRARDVVEIKHILIGLFKAPFFGLIIALIGCFRGFQVTGSTESIGKFTTISVVNAIFWVIACNAIISVILTEIGI